MIRLCRPSELEIRTWLDAIDRTFSHFEVGGTAEPAALEDLASHYVIDHRRFLVGHGRDLFAQARAALFAWRHFEIPWLELQGADRPVHEGQVVATLTRVLGIWFMNPCRVVYHVDAPGDTDEVAFAYGTLSGHVVSGEERFTVRRDPRTDEVYFEILAFSRPAMWLTQIGRPSMRRVQKRFADAAAEALTRACERSQSSRIGWSTSREG